VVREYTELRRFAKESGNQWRSVMLRWALLFLVIALIAGVFGFWQLEGTAMWIAEVLCFVFLILFVVSLVAGRRGPPVA
jgi:uncharacterized membrane protein YtjA (UPF0391 family)